MTPTPIALAVELRALADICAVTPAPDTHVERDLLLGASEVVRYELAGLAERIRAADRKVTGMERPGPVRPYRGPDRSDPRPEPTDPPPDPPGER